MTLYKTGLNYCRDIVIELHARNIFASETVGVIVVGRSIIPMSVLILKLGIAVGIIPAEGVAVGDPASSRLTFLCGNDDSTVGCIRTVKRCSSSSLQDRDGFYILHVEVVSAR